MINISTSLKKKYVLGNYVQNITAKNNNNKAIVTLKKLHVYIALIV